MTNEQESPLDIKGLVARFETKAAFIRGLQQEVPDRWIGPLLELRENIREADYLTISPQKPAKEVVDTVSGEQLIKTYRTITGIRNPSDEVSIQGDLHNIFVITKEIAANDTTSIARHKKALGDALALYSKHHGELDRILEEVEMEGYIESTVELLRRGPLPQELMGDAIRAREEDERENPRRTIRNDYDGRTDDE